MFEDFTQSALRRKTNLSIDLSDLPTLLDELRDAQQAAYPSADMGEIGGQLEDTFRFLCPNCGELKSSGVLMGAMVKAMQGMNPAMSTMFGGPNIANLAAGRCPGCNGSRVNLVYDPHQLKGIAPLQDDGKGASKSGCFLATACYGTPQAPQVIALRHFRDNVLLRSGLGRGFVSLYYRYSPPLAEYMRHHTVLCRTVRCLLVNPLAKFAAHTKRPKNDPVDGEIRVLNPSPQGNQGACTRNQISYQCERSATERIES